MFLGCYLNELLYIYTGSQIVTAQLKLTQVRNDLINVYCTYSLACLIMWYCLMSELYFPHLIRPR